MEYKGFWKSRPVSSLRESSTKRSQRLNAERLEKRKEFFWGSRIAESVSDKLPSVEKKKNPRVEMLLKWKAEKMKKLEEEKKKQKPAFKVGVLQKKATGSPLIISQSNIHVKKNLKARHIKPKANNTEPEKTGVLTRAKAKNMTLKLKATETELVDKPEKSFTKCYKYEGGKRKQIDSHVFKVPEVVSKLPCSGVTFRYSPKLTQRCNKSLRFDGKESNVGVTKVNMEATEDKDHTSETLMKPERLEKQIELKQEKAGKKLTPNTMEEQVKDKSPESFKEEVIDLQSFNVTLKDVGMLKVDYIPIHYSPFVTVRSGKKPKRKSKISLTFDVDEQIKKEENIFKCRIFSFRKYIDCETNRLLMMCEKWRHIYQEFDEVPTDVEGDIDSAIGKTNLLTSDKFMQFKGLIDKCENGDPFVKVDDLQGFQDWVSIEVERIDEEFRNLEKRKCNNWKSETALVDTAKSQKVKVIKNVKKKVEGKSSIRSHILAARKLLKERNVNCGETIELPTTLFELVKMTTPKKKENLLKDVLTSETKKESGSSTKKKLQPFKERRNSGLEIMIATQKNKFPTPVKIKLQKSPSLTDFEILTRRENTPSKSILKKVSKTSSSKGHVKFENISENSKSGRKLSEKYFRPVADDKMSPMRAVLGDLGNLTPTGMTTRSKTKQLSFSPLVN